MRKLKIGIVGLGRMGKEYARILKYKVPNADLIAACSIDANELDFAKKELDIQNLYTDYSEMLSLNGLECVFVISSTDMHADQMIEALQAGKHVFCEKPLAITLDKCHQVQIIANQYPHLKAEIGFVRRFDKSYQYAKEMVESGKIGKPYLVKSQTIDMDTVSDFQIQYVNKSGGIFHDYNVHDIDLARWFLGSEMSSVYAIGGAYKYEAFAAKGDADNVMTTCQFLDGTMAVINAGRTAIQGHDTYTEIMGTEGTLRIGRPANKNRVEIYDAHGVRTECLETFWDRFEDAFRAMTQDFVDCVLDDRQPDLKIVDAIKTTEAAIAFTKSFRTKKIVDIK